MTTLDLLHADIAALARVVHKNQMVAKVAACASVLFLVLAGYFAYRAQQSADRLSRIEVVLSETRAGLQQAQENGRLITAGIAAIEGRLGIPPASPPSSPPGPQRPPRSTPPALPPSPTTTTKPCPLNVAGLCIGAP